MRAGPGTPPLPLLHESAELPGLREPGQSMHRIGHADEAQAASIELGQFVVPDSEQHTHGLIVIQQSTTVLTRERDELNIQSIIDTAQLAHAGGVGFRDRYAARQASRGSATQTLKATSGPPRLR